MEYYEDPRFGEGGRRPIHRPRPWPRGVKGVIIATAAAFVAQIIASRSPEAGQWMAWLELWPTAVFERGAVWQLVTYAFLHDIRFLMHILFNMLFLYWFGRAVETAWGTKRFLVFYLGAAAFSGLCYSAWVYLLGSPHPCIGASGAVMACMMVYAIWYPNRIILLFFIIPMRIRTFVILTVCIEVYNLWNLESDIASMAHLGGLLFGYFVVRAGPRVGDTLAAWFLKRDEGAAVEDNRRLDEILEKVHRKGIGSLSWAERRFLKRMSRRR